MLTFQEIAKTDAGKLALEDRERSPFSGFFVAGLTIRFILLIFFVMLKFI